jgi:hypothetical protein
MNPRTLTSADGLWPVGRLFCALAVVASLPLIAPARAVAADAAPLPASDPAQASMSAQASASTQVPAATAPESDHGFLRLGFDRLSGYKFVPPEFDPMSGPNVVPPTGEEQIPAQVKHWNGKKALVTGFMLPTKLDNGKATEFLLMANQMACCYGAVPNMNDWVIVRIPAGTPVVQDVPIAFRGTLKVGAMYENGYMTGIYELDADGPGQVAQ